MKLHSRVYSEIAWHFEIEEGLGKLSLRRHTIYNLHSCSLLNVSIAPLEVHDVTYVFLWHMHLFAKPNPWLPWQEKEDPLYQQTGLGKKKLIKIYAWGVAFYGAQNLDISENKSEIPWKFWNVVLEKDAEGQMEWWCEKLNSIHIQSSWRKNLHTVIWRKAYWIDHILHRTTFSRYWKIEGKRTRCRRCKQLLDGLNL